MTEREGKRSDRFGNHLSFTFSYHTSSNTEMVPPIGSCKIPPRIPPSTLSMIDKQLLPFAFCPCVTFRKGARHVVFWTLFFFCVHKPLQKAPTLQAHKHDQSSTTSLLSRATTFDRTREEKKKRISQHPVKAIIFHL